MKSLRKLLKRVRGSSSGQTATEYLMVVSVLAIAVMFSAQASMALFGEAMDTLTNSLATSLTQDGIRF